MNPTLDLLLTQVEQAAERLAGTLGRVGALPIGGTAIGTGLNAPPGFGAEVARRLAAQTGLPFTEASDHFAAQAAPDALVEVSSQLRGAAVALITPPPYRVAGRPACHRATRGAP